MKDILIGGAAPFEGFLECHLSSYQSYREQETEFNIARERLKNSTMGLILHPDISEKYKKYLKGVLRTF